MMDPADRRLATEAKMAQIENLVAEFLDRIRGEVTCALVSIEIQAGARDTANFHRGIGGAAARIGLARLAELDVVPRFIPEEESEEDA